MAKILANMVAVWALVVSPALCVAGVLENPCEESDFCDHCSDCVPHSSSCAEDVCHLIVVAPLRDCPEDDLVRADNEQIPNEVLPAVQAEVIAAEPFRNLSWLEKEPPGFPSPSFMCPLLI